MVFAIEGQPRLDLAGRNDHGHGRCYDAAGAAGGFGGVLGPLRGGGDGVMQVGGQVYTLLAHVYTHSTPSTFSLACARYLESPPPR